MNIVIHANHGEIQVIIVPSYVNGRLPMTRAVESPTWTWPMQERLLHGPRRSEGDGLRCGHGLAEYKAFAPTL